MRRLGLVFLSFVLFLGCDLGPDSSTTNSPTDLRAEYFFGIGAQLILEKSTNDVDADEPPGLTLSPGEEVVWKYTVSNPGTVAFTSVLVMDDKEGVICTIAGLAPGEEDTCSKSGIAGAEPYVNEGSAIGTHMLGTVLALDLSHYNGAARSVPLVEIDVKPGSVSNCIKDSSKGRLPVAILGSGAFDVSTVDEKTLLAGEAVQPFHWARDEDLNRDGFLDMILHFRTPELKDAGLLLNDTELVVSGETLGGGPFQGSDVIHLVGSGSCRGR